jgi:hypothetical protein
MLSPTRRARLVDLTDVFVDGCRVESRAPSVSNQSRYRVLCRCGSTFLAETGQIRRAQWRGTWGCVGCQKR